MRNYSEEEWKLIYAAWCVRHGDVPYETAIKLADECWGFHPYEDPEFMAEGDLAA
jgi:hypothetical protein